MLAEIQGLVATFLKGPVKRWHPDFVSINGWMKRFKDISRAEGFGTAYNKLRMETTMRQQEGHFVGTDYNGNRYYENLNAPSGHTRWVEYPTPAGVWGIDDKYDGSMVAPDWHGWLHYMHDMPGSKVTPEFSKPFAMPHRVNQTMERKYYTVPAGITSKDFSEAQPEAYHKPPGAWRNEKPRGRLGPKYQAWDPTGGQSGMSELRNYADNSERLHLP